MFGLWIDDTAGHMSVIKGDLIDPMIRDVIEKKKEIEKDDTLRYHVIKYTDGKREKQLEYI